MEAWSVHQLYKEAEVKIGYNSASELRKYAQYLIHSNLPVIFSLKHLSRITKIDYKVLCATVNRRRESANYKRFSIKKRSGGERSIHSVSGQLSYVQQFLNTMILQNVAPHPSSFAFHPNGGIRKCAAMHCGAQWLFQYDLSDFFYNITEVDVFLIFEQLGYHRLLAFELARICTTTNLPKSLDPIYVKGICAKPYVNGSSYRLGVLPQGAPTSPMLSNLAARELDERLFKFAIQNGLVYTRYADDITLSTRDLPHGSIGNIHNKIIHIIRTCRFMENKKKTRIAGPGSKKIVMGLLVDGDKPRLSKKTYKRIDNHLHAIKIYGISETAIHENFDSPYGFYNHLMGLLSFVKDVDMKRWNEFQKKLEDIDIQMETNL